MNSPYMHNDFTAIHIGEKQYFVNVSSSEEDDLYQLWEHKGKEGLKNTMVENYMLKHLPWIAFALFYEAKYSKSMIPVNEFAGDAAICCEPHHRRTMIVIRCFCCFWQRLAGSRVLCQHAFHDIKKDGMPACIS